MLERDSKIVEYLIKQVGKYREITETGIHIKIQNRTFSFQINPRTSYLY